MAPQVKSRLELEQKQKKSICKFMDQLIIMMGPHFLKMLLIRVRFYFFIYAFLDLMNAVN